MIETKQQVLSVSQLTQAIKSTLERQFFSVYVKGEITNLKIQSSGHVYFSLKDEFSQISAVIFKSTYSKLNKPLKIGDKILVQGQVNVYAPRGSYQIIIQKVQHEGLGDLLLKFHQLKKHLQDQGYFDEKHKKPIPKFPKTIGVITSPTGSVIQDIIHVLTRRSKGVHLILNPVKVQGAGSENEIAQAIEDFNTYQLADVLIVGRGGGSLEDLWCFNELKVAEAIFKSKIPIVSAVGHETDFTIADFVADARAPTPSAAAEIVVKEQAQQLEYLSKSSKILNNLLLSTYNHAKLQLSSILKHPLFASSETLLLPYFQKLDEKIALTNQWSRNDLALKKCALEGLEKRLKAFQPSQVLNYHKEKKIQYSKSLDQTMLQTISSHKKQLDYFETSITSKFLEIFKERKKHLLYLKNLFTSIDPKNLLKKGYCIPFAENKNSVIISSKQVCEGDLIRLQFADGKVLTKALTKETHNE